MKKQEYEKIPREEMNFSPSTEGKEALGFKSGEEMNGANLLLIPSCWY